MTRHSQTNMSAMYGANRAYPTNRANKCWSDVGITIDLPDVKWSQFAATHPLPPYPVPPALDGGLFGQTCAPHMCVSNDKSNSGGGGTLLIPVNQ